MTTLVIATSSAHKLREMQTYLTDTEWELVLKPDSIEVEETGTTFMENAQLKATQVAAATGQWAIGDDSGMAVEALDGAPGLYSARYAPTVKEAIDRVLGEMADQTNRRAKFICALAVADPSGAIVLQAEGVCEGVVLTAPRGTGGFGYDPIFYLPAQQMTFAEMPAERKHQLSHRGLAFAAMLPQLRSLHQEIDRA
ncbi:MAG: RdgB/HAM1 family non-canonical purine NTP pyrophosphatase [Leptolyngbyaceae cyanobacterium SM1_3_5]|nr:RdgB/HAM1 family non-canonical purine NTP pyrophosphatase [Leptolyngbyaceae cyanobacterium SM1_3_5]